MPKQEIPVIVLGGRIDVEVVVSWKRKMLVDGSAVRLLAGRYLCQSSFQFVPCSMMISFLLRVAGQYSLLPELICWN